MVIVGGLLVIAGVLAVILLSTIGSDDPNPSGTATPFETGPTVVTAATTVDDGIPPAINVAGVISFDPKGDPPDENDEQLPNVFDQAEGTAWYTTCYLDRFLGAKGGVGVVIPLTEPATGSLQVTFASKPWHAEIYTSDALPSDLAGWGGVVDRHASSEDVGAVFQLGPQPHSYVLIWLRELAEERPPCSGNNPYRGGIAEVSFTPGPGVG